MAETNSNPSPKAPSSSDTKSKRGGLVKLIVFALAIVGLFIAFQFLPVADYLKAVLGFIEGFGVWGPVILALAYIVATILMVPGSILTLAAGAMFGLGWGTASVMAGSVLGALAAFVCGRTVARGFVEQKAKENPRFAAIDQAVERDGFKIVLLTRLSPVFPFNLLNYLFSITKVRTRDYFLASWIGMIPGTVMYVYVGAVVGDLTKILAGDVETGVWQYILWGAGLLATVAVTVYVTRIARKALKEYVPDHVVEGDS